MKLRTRWTRWSGWRKYRTRTTNAPYQSRKKTLSCGRLHLATLVESTSGEMSRFYMYSLDGCRAHGNTASEALDNFTARYLELLP